MRFRLVTVALVVSIASAVSLILFATLHEREPDLVSCADVSTGPIQTASDERAMALCSQYVQANIRNASWSSLFNVAPH